MVGDARGGVSLEILDGAGAVIREFDSSASGDDALPLEQGLNRFIWDLRYPGAEGGGRGPMAVPGRYTVRMNGPAGTQEAELELRIDPRVEMDGTTLADLQEQFEHNIRVRDLITDGRRALRQLDVLEGRENPEQVEEELAEVKATLLPPEDITVYPPRMLIDQINYLYNATMRSDQPPGGEATNRYQELRAQMDEVMATLQRLSRLVSQDER
jgi:hypothetical protein